jgi:hypothetical protein
MTRKDFITAAAGFAATLAASQVAFAQAQTPSRGEVGSARNIRNVRMILEKLIDQLQRDRHDYGGWRVKAIEHMRQARYDLDQALHWDATHGH